MTTTRTDVIKEVAMLKSTLLKFAKSEIHSEYFQEIERRYSKAHSEYVITEKRSLKNVQELHRVIQDGLNKLAEYENEICREILNGLDKIDNKAE